ncbi:MAG: hypothetical protein QOC61_1220 [Acidobacteriota bacterium]|nr:hypothetical protein [Acidobacteriota bacterium]
MSGSLAEEKEREKREGGERESYDEDVPQRPSRSADAAAE